MTKRPTNKVSSSLPRFSSENLLQQAIAGLLTRMPNISDVQILQGSQEYGKDVVFQFAGPLGESLPCACVIKNGKISGKVTENTSARTILIQIEQALDTPFVNGSGEESRIHRVYVISPEEIGQHTMQSVKGKLMGRAGQVVFLGGAKLFQLFRTYWIDFFADEYASIESHLAILAKKASNKSLPATADIYKLGSVSEAEASIYVHRWLSRRIKYYKLRNLGHMMLQAWRSEWTRASLDSFISTLESLKRLVRHLSSWQFLEEDGSRSSREIISSITQLSSFLQDKWNRAAEKEIGQRAYSTPGNLTITLGEDYSFKLIRITESITAGLDPLARACAASTILPSECSNISILSDPSWKLASAVDDFARYSPIDIFHPTEGLRIQFKEDDLLTLQEPILIVGSAGYGKTSFCRWHALADAENFRTKKSGILPVYLPLNALVAEKLDNFEEVFFKGLGRSALISDSHLEQATSIRLYLDGLDEVTSELQREAIVELVRRGSSLKGLKVQVILTSRDYVVSRALADIPRLELSPLTSEQIEGLKSEWFRGSPTSRENFEDQLDRVKALKGLMRTPLLATLMIMVFRQTGRLPESHARLYTIFIELLSGGWDLAKGVLRPSRFGQFPKIMVLSNLASSVHTKRVRNFEASDIAVATERTMRCDREMQEEMLEELVVDGVITRSGESYFFSHLSFQEFLTAKHLFGDPQSVEISRALDRFIRGDDWWREVIRFYIGLSESPANIVLWLLRNTKLKAEAPRINELLASVRDYFPDFDLDTYLSDNTPAHLPKTLWAT